MEKKNVLLLLACIIVSQAFAQNWKPVGNKISSPWADKINPAAVLPEYPRPQMVRPNWKNLNGLWDYAIVTKESDKPSSYQGKILVPFAVESSLSGVGKTVGKDSTLWYRNSFSIPAAMKGKKILLHFGAVDWQTDVFINGKKAAMHQGGFDPFSVDITPYLSKGMQELVVKVWDPTDEGPQPRGKQVRNPEGIWYTPVTGIWQTVWLEAVPQTYITKTWQTPDIDQNMLRVKTDVEDVRAGDKLMISAWDGKLKIAESTVNTTDEAVLNIPSPKLWSPASPFLYDLKIMLVRNGKTVDAVQSYFAMRKISLGKDAHGIQRMLLNNTFLFEYGPLDQGWWPDGLYTAPTDEALKFDIEKTKAMGFNMIRKHIKTEPARWYTYCDQMGMLVWQDMPSGDLGNRWEPRPGVYGLATDKDRTPESEGYYRKEWNAIMESLYNYPCIVVWLPFNEAWGQFKTVDITNWTMQKDPSRLVNSATGGNFYPVGHIVDLHNYPEPAMPDPYLFGHDRAIVLGEFGGLGLPVDGHTWQQKDNWGYQTFKNTDDLFSRYNSFTKRMQHLIRDGLSAAVYTQTTDVEVEINGLMTYDRKVIKMPEAKLKEANDQLYQDSLVQMP